MTKNRVIALLAGLAVLAACGGEPAAEQPQAGESPQETAAETEAPRSLKRVTFATTNISVNYLPNQVAYVMGFWEEEGLDVQMTRLSSATAVPAVASGAVDYGDATGSAIVAAARDVPIVMLVCGGFKPLYSLIAHPDFPNAEALRGQPIGVNQLGTEGSYQTTRRIFRDEYGQDPEGFTYVALGTSSARVSALESGQVAAAVIPPPHSEAMVEDGYHRIFGPDLLSEECSPGLNTSRQKLESEPEQIKSMLRGYAKGLKYMIENRDEAIDILAEWIEIDRGLAERSYDLVIDTFSYTGEISDEGFFAPLAAAIEEDAVDSSVTIDDVRDFSLWNEVIDELGYE